MVVVRKNVSKEQGDVRLIDEIRYFFYISNDMPSVSSEDIVFGCNDRCDQENLIAQLSAGVRSLCAPVDNLESNWACMVITSIAWNLKSWSALSIRIAFGAFACQVRGVASVLKETIRANATMSIARFFAGLVVLNRIGAHRLLPSL
jgi:hypothetical protein